MNYKWMLRTVFVLAVCLTRNLTSGHADRTSLDSNKTPHSPDPTKVKLEGFRNESFEVDSRITLLCTSTKIQWSEMIYVIWKISSQEKSCSIAVARNDSNVDVCEDGKKIYITAGGDYSLIISNFSIKDEGNYICDVSYHAEGYVESIYVSAWVQPKMAGRLETKGGHTFAICEVQSLPAASILWEPQWNFSSPETHSSRDARGVFTVTSRLQLPHNTFHKNLTCVASASHSKWLDTRFTIFTAKGGTSSTYLNTWLIDAVKWPPVLLGVYTTWAIIKLVTSLYTLHRNRGQFRKICCTSKTPTEEKNPQSQVYEEVELYVNSICGSSEARPRPQTQTV